MRWTLLTLLLLLLAGCAGGQGGSIMVVDMGVNGPPETAFTVHSHAQLIGGPLATGRIGDVLLKNDKVRFIIEQPGKTPWVGNFGGGIVDADLMRSDGSGLDNFGFMHPMVNVEWTVNVQSYEVVSDGKDGGAKVLRTYGIIDVYDYLDLDFVAPVAKAITGQTLYYDPRFDDVNDPFALTDLRYLNTSVITDYILEPGKNYVRIETTFENFGDKDVFFPFGDFVNGSGELMFMIPGLGFTPEMMPQIQGDTPALIYAGFDHKGVSYGYFYDMNQFMKEGEDGKSERLKSTSLSYSGVTGIILGEDFLKVLPLGGKSEPKINFSVPAHGKRTVTRYFVVGDGDGGSVMDAGFEVLGIRANKVSGIVRDGRGTPVPGAVVAVKNEDDSTVVTYRADSKGRFSGLLATGERDIDKPFGSGKYKMAVYKKGYKVSGEKSSGVCTPGEIDVRSRGAGGIECVLGESGIVKVGGGVVDAATGRKMAARMTIVGYAPSYKSKTGGDFEDKIIFERPLGVVDVYYVNTRGGLGVDGADSIRLPPGRYEFYFSRGVEYSMERITADVGDGVVTDLGHVELSKVIKTPGYVSADFHLHAIVSPDSAMSGERRALAAAGEGMDILQSSDHDFLLDYAPIVARLSSRGIIDPAGMPAITGQEISPNHMGHFSAFPLAFDGAKPCGGALDWGLTPSDVVGPQPDIVMSPKEITAHLRGLPENPVIQINHISDLPTSLLLLGGWVTSPFYYESYGVPPLSSYADPVLYRLVPHASAAHHPYAFGANDMVAIDADAIELTIGPELHDNLLLTSALPTWFNLLNTGVILTATGDSDSHREIANPLGIPRNFIASSVDPADGMGDFSEFDAESYAKAIKEHKVIVTTGPFIKAVATSENGESAFVGGTLSGAKIKLRVDVTSPDWAWFDTVEIYVNTEPVPADDENLVPLEGAADDPAKFYAPYHVPRYFYKPAYKFSLSDETLAAWKKEDGVISARVDVEMDLPDDSWIVVFVRGTEETEGFRSLFPFVTRALVDPDNPSAEPEDIDIGNIDMLTVTGAAAWAFTNPIFVDIAGDGFEPLYGAEWKFGGDRLDHAEAAPEAETGGAEATEAAPSAISVNSSLL